MIGAFLRIPPFPGAKAQSFVRDGTCTFNPDEICAALREHRVGGDFWAKPAALPSDQVLVLAPDNAGQLDAMLASAKGLGCPIAITGRFKVPGDATALPSPLDPWSVVAQASEVWAGSGSDLAIIAALSGMPVRLFDQAGPVDRQPDLVASLLQSFAACSYASPFDGEPWELIRVIDQLGEWRRLLESNRAFGAVYGVARWKRVTADPLLWDGIQPVPHRRKATATLPAGTQAAAWKSRTSPRTIAALEKAGVAVAEIEDGMIRSVGLGANCIPPLSIFVDRTGVYFDPNQPSDLESLLESGELPLTWVKRAEILRIALVNAGISKYGQSDFSRTTRISNKRRILVTGQVEDDRSMLSAGGNCTNLDLLVRARQLEPDAWIIYKPHPDVEAGHRKGHVADAEILRHANEIERKTPIATLIEQVDGLHVISSLAGFEALLRGKSVTTHGQPFYSGWGLTRDLGPANPRRTRRRSLDELVAATLIGYPRYIDPVTRLPCPPEVLVQRIVSGQARVTSWLVTLREWQGRLRLAWQWLTGARR